MTRRHGVMAPPPHDGPPTPGLMAADPAAALDHATAIRSLLWIVAGALAVAELLLHAAPKA
jgi:hypothetical protein